MQTKTKIRFLTLGLVLLTLVFWKLTALSAGGNFELRVLDVGQGDAVLVTTPQKIRILIDGGPGDAILRELGEVLPFGDSAIDLVILTHPDADHLEGLIPVLRRYKVQAVLRTDATKTTSAFSTFEKLVKENDILDEKLLTGDRVKFSDGPTLQVVWPMADGTNEDKVNESSIVG